MADMDDSNWEETLSDNDDKEFDVQYQNWQDKADGGKDQLLWKVKGAGWLDVFSRDYDAVLQEDKATGGDAALYFGITGITNFIGALLTTIFIAAPSTNDFITFSWVLMAILHWAAWITVIVLWIMTTGEEAYEEIILFVDAAYIIKYATVYGGYGLCFLLILISSIINPGTSPFD